jgi:hypothetical protein
LQLKISKKKPTTQHPLLITMNITIQQCNNCGAKNDSGNTTWTRVFGAFTGAPNLSLQTMPNSVLPANAVRPTILDFCPTCSPTMTLAKIVTMSTPVAPAAKAATATPSTTATK